MNSMKIPGKQPLDLKISASNTSDFHKKQALEVQEDSV